jgi:hypothetical protein
MSFRIMKLSSRKGILVLLDHAGSHKFAGEKPSPFRALGVPSKVNLPHVYASVHIVNSDEGFFL